MCALAMTGCIGLFSEAVPAAGAAVLAEASGAGAASGTLGVVPFLAAAGAGLVGTRDIFFALSSVIPPGISHPFHSWSRLEWLAFGTYFALAVGLLWRFVPPRKMHATLLDRVALTIFALSFLIVGAIPISVAFKFPVIGLAALLIAWMAYRFDLSKHRRLATHASRELSGKVQ